MNLVVGFNLHPLHLHHLHHHHHLLLLHHLLQHHLHIHHILRLHYPSHNLINQEQMVLCYNLIEFDLNQQDQQNRNMRNTNNKIKQKEKIHQVLRPILQLVHFQLCKFYLHTYQLNLFRQIMTRYFLLVKIKVELLIQRAFYLKYFVGFLIYI